MEQVVTPAVLATDKLREWMAAMRVVLGACRSTCPLGEPAVEQHSLLQSSN